jgi:hypothetical protein
MEIGIKILKKLILFFFNKSRKEAITIENIAPLEYVSIIAKEIKIIMIITSLDLTILSKKYTIKITLTTKRYKPKPFAFTKRPNILAIGLPTLGGNSINPIL